MTAAMRRLEDLLQNPGPGITVKPAGKRFHRDGDPVEEFEADLAADVGPEIAPAPSRDMPETRADDRADAEEADEDDDAPQTAISDEMPAESVWAKRLGRGPDTPPKRAPKKVEPKIELPKGMRPGIKKPASSSGGLFGVFLS